MNTFSYHNQNLPESDINSEAVQSFQCLERQLEEYEARIRCLLATLPQIVWFAKENGNITNFNQRWYEYTGLSALNSLGWEFLKVIHPEDRELFISSDRFSLSLATAQPNHLECRIRGRDGIYRWFISQRTPVQGAGTQVLGWVGTYTLKDQFHQVSALPWRDSAAVQSIHRSSLLKSPASKHGVSPCPRIPSSWRPLNDRQTPTSTVKVLATPNTADSTQQRFRNFMNELSRAIVWEAEATTEHFTFVSSSAQQILGYPVEQWLSQPDFWLKLIHPEDRQWTVALYRKQMTQSRDYELEYRCVAADNRVVWVRDRACVIRDERGQAIKRRGLMVDITPAKQTQVELQTHLCQQALVAQLTQAALSGTAASTLLDESVYPIAQALAVEYCKVWELLPESNVLRLRAGVGWRQGLVGQATIEANSNTHVGYTLQVCQPVVVEDLRCETRFQGSPLLHEHNIISGMSVVIEGTLKKMSLGSSEVAVAERPFGVLGVYTSRQRSFSRQDVDFLQSVANVLAAAIKFQQADEALHQAKTDVAQLATVLEQRTQELEQFTYVASHDLKAPLRAIANLSQWIEEDIADQLSEENFQQMQLLRGRVYRLEALIDGLVQYSRAGRLTSKPESVNVEALLLEVIENVNPPAQFTIEIAPDMPTLVTERLPLEQVFTHLIGNAIAHHPLANGTLSISVREDSDTYEFAVADNGAGIDPKLHKKVFEIFHSLPAKAQTQHIGIGLPLAKRIVERKGGSIRLESQVGQGATFYFTWPKQ
jgi:PAS domain S-box-containing protein